MSFSASFSRLLILDRWLILVAKMVTIEVNLKEGEATPEQHLDEGEHIERVIVPLSELYDKLKGKSSYI